MDYGLFALAQWVEDRRDQAKYSGYDEDRYMAGAFDEVLDKIKAMQKEVQTWTLGL